MTTLAAIVALPWTELVPCPEAPIALALSFALSFWYGYRHPEEY